MNILSQLAQSTYEYTSPTTSSGADGAAALLLVTGFMFFYFLALIATYVISSLALGRIFKKAGVASWIAWVPFYNTWKILEIGGQQGFWAVLAIIPVVNIVSAVFTIIAMYNIGLKLGKSGAFVLLAIFLPIVWVIWLAVDTSAWNDSLGAPSVAYEHAGTPPTAAPLT